MQLTPAVFVREVQVERNVGARMRVVTAADVEHTLAEPSG